MPRPQCPELVSDLRYAAETFAKWRRAQRVVQPHENKYFLPIMGLREDAALIILVNIVVTSNSVMNGL